jgi:hypothetical protein
MSLLFSFSTLFFMVLAPVIVAVLFKQLYIFFTQDLDEFDSWEEDDDDY